VGAELFHADRRMDIYDGVNIRFSQFCEKTEKLKEYSALSIPKVIQIIQDMWKRVKVLCLCGVLLGGLLYS